MEDNIERPRKQLQEERLRRELAESCAAAAEAVAELVQLISLVQCIMEHYELSLAIHIVIDITLTTKGYLTKPECR